MPRLTLRQHFPTVAHLRLVLEILPYFSGGEIPNLDEPVHAAAHQELTIRRESGTLYMRFVTKFNLFGQLRRVFLVVLVPDRRFTSEQIDSGA